MTIMKKCICSLFFVALLSSCIAQKEKLIILQHPETMEFERCQVADWGSKEALAENEACVEAYKQKGYVVWGTR